MLEVAKDNFGIQERARQLEPGKADLGRDGESGSIAELHNPLLKLQRNARVGRQAGHRLQVVIERSRAPKGAED